MVQLPLPSDKITYFDKIYSFDKNDCEKYQFKFITNFIYIPKEEIKPNFDLKVFTIQSKSQDRMHTINKIADELDRLSIKNYEFHIYGKPSNKANKNIKIGRASCRERV